ncbi:MAG: serine hydroxymethyltransferase [Phycisphaerae bacterium]|nr:serine hydroxymethyltransferase [Phycisphaerae bacterium]NIS52293.1 serine hydroxymethyltransferase [Phycisphaerae bacterium]NIU09839.1 serine hydroxymethyltransferase [Phycisphaerae bacterium]NIU57490.1 serine hydroxymethyltransferase [Phycisphaerae bacterium]NIW93975.1 serine hydroxymethyltransferase [Phycisphaerae bacterium]
MVTALEQYDPQIFELVRQESARESSVIRLIPSENYVSRAVMQASGSCLTNKYAEGYPGRRYYEGQQVTDLIERLAQERAKKIFKADHANVQPYSGSVANLAAYAALIEPGDMIMGMSLTDGGHLTHGWNVSLSSRFFKSVSYPVNPQTGRLDYDHIADMAKKHKPKIIISGATAYPREIDFEIFGRIAKDVGAYHVSDIAHIAGLVVAGLHKSPVPYADIVSSTTHKTLRGARGGMLLCKAEHAEKVDRAVFPGLQGGPHMHTLTAIAVALAEADTPEFVAYARQIVKNSKALARKLMEYGFKLMSDGTDNHLILIDLRNKKVGGKKAAKALDRARIVCNYNTIPGDTAPPANPSGLRMGTPAMTTRGMKEQDAEQIAGFINTVVENINNESVIENVAREVLLLCSQFPIPGHFIIPNQKNPDWLQNPDINTPWLF